MNFRMLLSISAAVMLASTAQAQHANYAGPEQRVATEKLMAEHKTEARAIGAKLIDAERALDQLFASGKAGEAELAQQVRAVAALQGEFRLSHLETHRRLRPLLTQEQVTRYAQLRGYAGGHFGSDHHTH